MKPANLFRHGFTYLLISIALIVLIATILRPSREGADAPPQDPEADVNPWDQGAGWAVCAPIILLVLGAMARTYGYQRTLARRVDEMRFADIPASQGTIPEAAQPVVDSLLERGFTRIDDVMIVSGDSSPVTGIPTFMGSGGQLMAFVASPVGFPKPNLTLETLYTDGAVLQTYHPYGVSSKSARHEASRKGRTPAEAIDYHMQRMQVFGQKHGDVFASSSTTDRVAWATAFGKPPGSPLNAWYHHFGVLLIPALVLLIIMSLSVNTHLFPDMLRAWLLYVPCILLIGLLVYSVVAGRLVLRR